MRAALYARVSTADQEPQNQLTELARYCQARNWEPVEYVDHGVSGAKDRRPALDRLLKDARRRKVDVVICWRLDRLGRNLKHLITLLDELAVLGVAFVSLAEGIDATTPKAPPRGRGCNIRRPAAPAVAEHYGAAWPRPSLRNWWLTRVRPSLSCNSTTQPPTASGASVWRL